MKLSKDDRENVAMLLRCAADVGWLHEAGEELGLCGGTSMDLYRMKIYGSAWQAAWTGPVAEAYRENHRDDRRSRYLEAALLVEEGVLP